MKKGELKIPSQITLLANTLHVRIIPDKEFDELHQDPEYEGAHGVYDDQRMSIDIRESSDKKGHTYLHELTHGILTVMNHPLNDDETFVDLFSGLLHQALVTAKFKRAPRRKVSEAASD